MLLRELFENETKHVTFCFGRMNPPTIGHKQVLDTMKSQGGDMKIFVSQSQDAKKNPLDYGTKIKFIKEMFPSYAADVVENAGLNTVVKVASYLFDEGYNAATFVAGSDRLEDMKKLLTQYNGVEGKAHGYYKFDVLDFVSSGDREDGAEGVAGISASGAREAAANNNFEKFKEATGAGILAKPLFAAVRKGMNIKENSGEEMKAEEFVTEYKKDRKAPKFNIKPRTGHAPTQTGAGAHKDKKKAQKQGDVKHKGKVDERVRDPEDWDEGNTEPPNNMAVYINGKLWKVFQGNGYYADDEREMRQYYKLQDWARKKSEATGKKWEVSRTGAPATK